MESSKHEDEFQLFGPATKRSGSESPKAVVKGTDSSGSASASSKSDTKASNDSSATVTSKKTAASASQQGVTPPQSAAHPEVELYETVGEMFTAMMQSLHKKLFGFDPAQKAAERAAASHSDAVELFETPGEMFFATLESVQGKIARGDPTIIAIIAGIALVVKVILFRRTKTTPVPTLTTSPSGSSDRHYMDRLTHD
jgi:hypothetical protein